MKGYWVVAVQDVIKPDKWEQVLSSWGNYVEKSNGVVNPISFGPPKAVYESGIEKTTAVIEFPSLDQAVHARTEDPDYYQGVIEADGTPVENKVIRDFRIIEVEDGWMKPGHGYWLVWVREFKDKDSWLEQWTHNPLVGGSSPPGPTIYPSIILKSLIAISSTDFPAAPRTSLLYSSLFLALIASCKEGNSHKAKGSILPSSTAI